MKQDQLLTIPALMSAAVIAKAAATEKGAGIPLLQNTAINIGIDADALTTARNNNEQSKVVLAEKRSLLAAVVVTVRAFLTLGRDILKPVLGGEYSQAYDGLGLIGSTMIPRTAEELLVVLDAFKAFFTAHPELEDVSRDITATHVQDLYDQLLAAQMAVNLQVAESQSRKTLRDAAADKLRKRLRGLIDEMGQTIDPLDPRWLAFGFKMPGAVETPDIVEGLVGTLINPTTAALKWKASARADYYRVFRKIHGTEDDYVAIGSPADLDFTIENLPAGAQIDIVVAAVNMGSESQFSQAVTITTHA